MVVGGGVGEGMAGGDHNHGQGGAGGGCELGGGGGERKQVAVGFEWLGEADGWLVTTAVVVGLRRPRR